MGLGMEVCPIVIGVGAGIAGAYIPSFTLFNPPTYHVLIYV